jgi:predicted nucleic-acid-binding protein
MPQRRRTGFRAHLVVCELVWVLDRVYDQTRARIAATLELILEDGLFEFERDAVVRQCLDLYRSGKAGFSDYLIGEISRESGCRDTVTFDRALRSAPGFTLLH